MGWRFSVRFMITGLALKGLGSKLYFIFLFWYMFVCIYILFSHFAACEKPKKGLGHWFVLC